MPGTVADGPTVSLSFANNFWGKEDAGVQPLLERMHNAKVTCDELKAFYNSRAALEDEYSRKLIALCRKPLGSSETGTLRASLDVMRGEVETMGKSHQAIAAQMKSELEEPLAAFAGGMKERRKIVQNGIEKLFKLKVQQTQAVNKSRDRYEQDCLKIKGYLAQGHMVMGQEERKNKAKMEKTQIQLASTSNDYESAVKALEETTGRWNRDWKAACDKFQDLEEERLDFTKSSLWTFANIASTVCVSDDGSCEKIRISLEGCEVEKDITSFIQERGTGQEIPDPPKYINFCRGDVNDTASEASDDEAYSVAQFQRTINPAFRSSSPQPSVFESHHDPQSDLAVRMGLHEGQTPPSRETTLTPQKAMQGPPPLIDYRRQAQSQAQLQHGQVEEFAKVPHNEYPTHGMTMFCRTAPPSDQSSAPSPLRPSSRDSQSEYSNPTSFSSHEPVSGKQSPTKQSIVSAAPAISPTKQVQKKRSGFFSNSPFRRKSKHEKEPPVIAPPEPRNIYGSSNSRNADSSASSPTRGYGQAGNQSRIRDTHSGSPEPVDPRANFQLNVGNNVFDVASPDTYRNKPNTSNLASPTKELDPIAQALAELKGLGKQSSVRMSADRYHGISTPAPGMGAASRQNSDIAAAQCGTPPPSYNDPPVKRLDLPQPAFTAKQMRQTTERYVGRNQDMYGSSRPGTRGGGDVPRATSPLPMRSTSPKPGYNTPQNQGQGGYTRSVSPNPQNQGQGGYKRSASPNLQNQGQGGYNRSASPNPYISNRQTPNSSPSKQGYTGGNSGQYSRHASPGTSPTKSGYANGSGRYAHHGSPGDLPRAVSPQPQYARQERPSSSGGMALQLSDGGQGMNQRARGNTNARPMTYYGGQPPRGSDGGMQDLTTRERSKSISDGRQYTKDGRPILHFARALYLYRAAIPEELSFAKGDILAVLRLQDDGWWEAEVTGKSGQPGLVPSNYLQPM